MSIDYRFAVKKLQSLEELHVVYAAATNMPFVTCDEETFNDQIWIFSTAEGVQGFAQKYEEQRIVLRDVRVPKISLGAFYMDLHSMGINEVVFCDGIAKYPLEFTKLVQLPDFSRMPEQKRPLMNSSLQLSTIYFLQMLRRPGIEPDKEKLEPLAEEMYANIVKAKFLMPVQMNETSQEPGKVNVPYITDAKGNKFQPIFSDHAQYTKHVKRNKTVENTKVLVVGIEGLQKYLLSSVQGYMINPDGYCHCLTMDQIKFINERFA